MHGHPDFSSGFQVIDLQTTKNAKILQNPISLSAGKLWKNRLDVL